MIRLPRLLTSLTWRAPLALLALIAPASLAACAAAPPPAASAEPPPPGAFSVGQHREVSPIDGEMLALAHAEEEIDRAFPAAAERGAPRKGAKTAPRDDEDKPGATTSKEDRLAAGGDRCSIACQALSSMASSADHLCKLAGETDGRCEDAQARVRGATSRVKSSCPACSVSIAAPPAPAGPPKTTPPAGPAPGMPASTPPGMPPSTPPGMPR